MSLLTVILLLNMGPPQQYQIQPLSPEQLTNGLMAYQAQQAQALDRIQIDTVRDNSNVCFAIRSYIFKREDGNAPVLVDTINCTPAIAFQQRRVGHPRGELVPLTLGGTDSR
jgi:hypothetical protein